MPNIHCVLPQVKSHPEGRPSACRRCGACLWQRHGRGQRRVRDPWDQEVQVERYRCSQCGGTQRHYPQGIDQRQHSQRVAAGGVLLWVLGLSLRSCQGVLAAFWAVSLSSASVWRDGQRQGQALRRRSHGAGFIPVLGADETVVKVRGRRTVIGYLVDAGSGTPVGFALLGVQDAAGFARWLGPQGARLGVQVLVTDDLATYKPVVETLGLEHQVCLAHVRKNGTRRLKGIQGYDRVKEKLKGLLRDLPQDGAQQLLALEPWTWDEPRLRALVVDLETRWRSLTCYKRREDVPATNNRTEQAIGRTKVRYKTFRGLGSLEGAMNFVALTLWL